jgi:hypothetical protein
MALTIQEIAAALGLRRRRLERRLRLLEDSVDLHEQLRPGSRRRGVGEPLHDLQPALDVPLHLERSEYSSHSRLVERCDAGLKYCFADPNKIRSWNSRILGEQLRDALVRMMNAAVVRVASRESTAVHALKNDDTVENSTAVRANSGSGMAAPSGGVHEVASSAIAALPLGRGGGSGCRKQTICVQCHSVIILTESSEISKTVVGHSASMAHTELHQKVLCRDAR